MWGLFFQYPISPFFSSGMYIVPMLLLVHQPWKFDGIPEKEEHHHIILRCQSSQGFLLVKFSSTDLVYDQSISCLRNLYTSTRTEHHPVWCDVGPIFGWPNLAYGCNGPISSPFQIRLSVSKKPKTFIIRSFTKITCVIRKLGRFLLIRYYYYTPHIINLKRAKR